MFNNLTLAKSLFVQAIDYDEGKHSKIWYSIQLEDFKKTSEKFILHPDTGELRLNFSNPYLEDMIGVHRLLIKVYLQAIISIQVLGENNNTMDFEQKVYFPRNYSFTAVALDI